MASGGMKRLIVEGETVDIKGKAVQKYIMVKNDKVVMVGSITDVDERGKLEGAFNELVGEYMRNTNGRYPSMDDPFTVWLLTNLARARGMK